MASGEHKKINYKPFVPDRVPPQVLEIEEVVLGSLLLESESIIRVADTLKPQMFYKVENQYVAEEILNLYRNQQKIDILTVTHALKKANRLDAVGGAYYIAKLTNRVVSSHHLEDHVAILIETFIKRELIRIGLVMGNQAHDDELSTEQIMNAAIADLYTLTGIMVKKNYEHVSIIIDGIKTHNEERIAKNESTSGLSSGYVCLDRITNGWQKPDLIILAARPGVGKTSLLLSIARNQAKSKIPVAIFSLEMSSEQLATRLISIESGIDFTKIRDNNLTALEKSTVSSVSAQIANYSLWIDDTSKLNILEFAAKAKRLKQQHGIQMIYVDYLQLMTANSGKTLQSRENEISAISRELKAVAKDLNIPIMALSQLSREAEKRKTPRPVLSDLRESGAIEQDADIVIFIYRPEYHGTFVDKANNDLRGKVEIIFAKHRNGDLTSAHMEFVKELTLFREATNAKEHEFQDNSLGEEF